MRLIINQNIFKILYSIMDNICHPIFKASPPSFNSFYRPRTSQTLSYKKLTTMIADKYRKIQTKGQPRLALKHSTNLNILNLCRDNKSKEGRKKQRRTEGPSSLKRKNQNNWYQNLLKSQKIAIALKTNSNAYNFRNASSYSINTPSQAVRSVPICTFTSSHSCTPTSIHLTVKNQSSSQFLSSKSQTPQDQSMIDPNTQIFRKCGSLRRVCYENKTKCENMREEIKRRKKENNSDIERVDHHSSSEKMSKIKCKLGQNEKQRDKEEYFSKWNDQDDNQDYLENMLYSAWQHA